jgi:hypothetical protein
MKAAIVHQSALIDTLLARIAASKLAHAEADDQYAQLMQALEAENAAVLNVCIQVPSRPRLSSISKLAGAK